MKQICIDAVKMSHLTCVTVHRLHLPHQYYIHYCHCCCCVLVSLLFYVPSPGFHPNQKALNTGCIHRFIARLFQPELVVVQLFGLQVQCFRSSPHWDQSVLIPFSLVTVWNFPPPLRLSSFPNHPLADSACHLFPRIIIAGIIIIIINKVVP